MVRQTIAVSCIALLLAAGCSEERPADPAAETTAQETPTEEAEPAESSAEEPDDATLEIRQADASLAESRFDTSRVPVTDHDLGTFPFLAFPSGYEPVNRPHNRAYARFPYWLGDGVRWVEGRTYSTAIGTKRGKTYSELELRRNMEKLLEAVGGVEIFEGTVGRTVYYENPYEDEIGGGFIDAVNGYTDDDAEVTVHLIRQTDREVWVQLATDSLSAGYVLTETRPFEATAKWGDEFPHFTAPDGYEVRTQQRDFDRFPFWAGDRWEWVEGRTLDARVTHKDGNRYSMHELQRNLDAAIEQVGGTKVFEGTIPEGSLQDIDEEIFRTYSDGAGFRWNKPITIYKVERDGKEAWIHSRLEYLSGGWVIAEREGFEQTAGLIEADRLKQQLDTDGKVALQVHFATDKADILPESQPQIEQVLKLLQDDPDLKLSIDGHTDDTGSVEHNQRLSEARARSVVAALTDQGIDANRLKARGFGQGKPVADNDTEEGKADNRRVELVRLD
ncbi:OmpA family protein [Luteimonas salinilitoris]|uniref:OmpA family protein n=1 Tax=Luteimonas salinilitoris TaxID=3237697 RepID=A0ABV4HMX8_9GAMM